MKQLAATTIGKREDGIDLRTQDFIYPAIVEATTMSYKIDFDRDLDYVSLSVRKERAFLSAGADTFIIKHELPAEVSAFIRSAPGTSF